MNMQISLRGSSKGYSMSIADQRRRGICMLACLNCRIAAQFCKDTGKRCSVSLKAIGKIDDKGKEKKHTGNLKLTSL